MFGNNKVQEEMKSLVGQVLEAKNDIRNLAVEAGKLRSTLNLHTDMQKKEEEFLTNFEENAKKVEQVGGDFEKVLYDFKLLSGELQKKLLDKFDEIIKKEVNHYFEKLQSDLRSVSDLKEKVESTGKEVDAVKAEISKLVEISKEIKKEDFELTKHAKKLQDMDNEKLELMRKIDSLERLLARLKRGNK